jgi:hypothetical protein
VDVYLPERLEPMDADMPAYSREGGGSFTMATLWSNRPDEWGGRYQFDIMHSPIFYGRGYSGDSSGALPPGRYRLYLHAAQPASMTIEFPRLPEGSLELAPTDPAPFAVGPLRQQDEQTYTKFGKGLFDGGGGFSMMTARIPSPPPGTRIEICSYWDSEAVNAGEAAYDPGCPGGASAWSGPVTTPGGGGFQATFGGGGYGLRNHGANVTVPVGPPPAVDTWAVWASYEFAPSYPLPPPWVQEDRPAVLQPPTPPGEPGPETRGQAILSSQHARTRAVWAQIPLACPRGSICTGRVSLPTGKSSPYRFEGGSAERVPIRLSPGNLRRLRRHGSFKTAVTVNSRLDGMVRQTRSRLTIHRSGRRP